MMPRWQLQIHVLHVEHKFRYSVYSSIATTMYITQVQRFEKVRDGFSSISLSFMLLHRTCVSGKLYCCCGYPKRSYDANTSP